MSEERNSRDELRVFARRHPELSVECFECEGGGEIVFDQRGVECWRCLGFGTVPYNAFMVRFILEKE